MSRLPIAGQRAGAPDDLDAPAPAPVEARVFLIAGARDETAAWELARTLGAPVIAAVRADAPGDRPMPPGIEGRLIAGPHSHLRAELLSEFASGGARLAVGVEVGLAALTACTVLLTGGTAKPRWTPAARALAVDLELTSSRPEVVQALWARVSGDSRSPSARSEPPCSS